MTRKRFIRLLMARGIQRNEAQQYAVLVHKYGSYQRLFQNVWMLHTPRSLGKAMESIGKAVAACSAQLSAFIKAILAATERRPLNHAPEYIVMKCDMTTGQAQWTPQVTYWDEIDTYTENGTEELLRAICGLRVEDMRRRILKACEFAPPQYIPIERQAANHAARHPGYVRGIWKGNGILRKLREPIPTRKQRLLRLHRL